MPVTAVPVTYGNPVDLISQEYAANALAAGGTTLSSAQNLIVPTLITAASREIARYCGRPFTLTAYNEILTPEGGRQDRGEPATAQLAYFPVQSVTSVQTGRAAVLTVTNTDTSTNQLANVAFGVSGDVEYSDLQYVSLVLTTVASGTTTQAPFSFTTYTTVGALATAINNLGSGWKATVGGGTPNPGLFPSTDLVGAREPKNAFSPGATLDVFTADASSYDIDRSTGIMTCYGLGGFGWGGAWGPSFGGMGDGFGDLGGGALGWGQYRVVYTAGFATIPESIQQVCAELVKASLERLRTDSTLQSETTGKYSWVARQELLALPSSALQVLMFYKDNFV